MSYCRFGEADAYIYYSAYDALVCMACSLMPIKDDELFPDTFIAETDYPKMLDHIAEHRNNGDYIPFSVDERLKREMQNISEYMAGAAKHVDSCDDLWCPGCEERQ
jgi:hypothetical protein